MGNKVKCSKHNGTKDLWFYDFIFLLLSYDKKINIVDLEMWFVHIFSIIVVG